MVALYNKHFYLEKIYINTNSEEVNDIQGFIVQYPQKVAAANILADEPELNTTDTITLAVRQEYNTWLHEEQQNKEQNPEYYSAKKQEVQNNKENIEINFNRLISLNVSDDVQTVFRNSIDALNRMIQAYETLIQNQNPAKFFYNSFVKLLSNENQEKLSRIETHQKQITSSENNLLKITEQKNIAQQLALSTINT
ncbi:hypothetical protein ['Camptotheca acuminata' phytoplasma]|uniref:hypothetical protein n=1 Tax='Camptotheca acuminata' phytoplasma TaxID=3239192 RepID=UPI00351A9483